MVGSASTLRRYAPVEKLLDYLQQEDMISLKIRPVTEKCLSFATRKFSSKRSSAWCSVTELFTFVPVKCFLHWSRRYETFTCLFFFPKPWPHIIQLPPSAHKTLPSMQLWSESLQLRWCLSHGGAAGDDSPTQWWNHSQEAVIQKKLQVLVTQRYVLLNTCVERHLVFTSPSVIKKYVTVSVSEDIYYITH